MKKIIVITIIAILSLIAATNVSAKDKIITTEIQKVYHKQDKNGEPYTRLVISEKRQLNGIEYPASVLLMAFSDVSDQVANLSAGDKLKAIVSESQYNGSVNYRLVHVLNN